MSNRPVKCRVKAKPALEGAGGSQASLRIRQHIRLRSVSSLHTSGMMFGGLSAGFPWHPHRGKRYTDRSLRSGTWTIYPRPHGRKSWSSTDATISNRRFEIKQFR